jgi:hypothetical protein
MPAPDYTGLFRFVYDWQTFIAGILAVGGGWLAYRAGMRQARTAQGQLEHMKAAAKEHDRRSREDLLAMFDREATRIAALATIGCSAAEKHQGGIHPNVPPQWAAAFTIAWVDVEGPGVSTLVPAKVRLAAIELRAKVEQLEALLTVKAPLDELRWVELLEAIKNVHDRADKLQRALGEHRL